MDKEIVIHAEDISKRYRLGVKENKSETLVGQFLRIIKYPFQNFKRLASLSRFKDDEDDSVFWALRNIDFQVGKGEILGVIGKNGAGKSTLLKLLSRITEPTSGQITIKGRVSSLLEVGTGFHPELTGRDNIYMNGTILGMTKKEIDEKLEEIIEFSGITKHLDTPVKFYSSGMKVRLGFSVAAHLEPEILIIDEVLAVGDVEFQKKCLGKMDDVAGQGRTVIFVSHNMAAIKNLCSRGLFLKNGKIEKEGAIQDVIDSYLDNNQYVADTHQINWDSGKSPGNEDLRLRSFFLYSSKRKGSNIFSADEEINIELNFNVKNVIRGARFVIQILTDSETIAFATTNHFLMGNELKAGNYKTKCIIPKSILNLGTYTIQLHAGIPGFYRIIEPFQISKLHIESVERGSTYNEKWPGVVLPQIEWTLEENNS